MTGALGVFTLPEAKGESQCDQVNDLTVFGVECDCRCGHDGVDNAKGRGLLLFDRRVLNAVGFKLTVDMSI